MCMGNGKESMYAYGGLCKRLQGIHTFYPEFAQHWQRRDKFLLHLLRI